MRSLLLLILGIVVAGSTALAEPHYSVLFGQSCFLCHANPTGRGLRSTYGSQFFAPKYLSTFPVTDSALAKYSPQISPSVLIGVDIREIWMAESSPVDSPSAGWSQPFGVNTGSSALMQGTLHLAFQPSEQVQIRYSQDLRNVARFEAYGLAQVLPFHGYVKLGQFQENYGWAFSDHSTFVRTGLWGDYYGNAYSSPTPPGYGVGGEVGFSAHHVTLSGSLTEADNATPGPVDANKRWFARAMVQQGYQPFGLEFTAGASWRHQAAFGPDTTRQRWWGGFGGIGWAGLSDVLGCDRGFGFLATSALFEYDRKAWHPNYANGGVVSAYSTSQLNVQIQPGLWLVGQYDWQDNTGRKDGNEVYRYSAGVQFFPWPWVDIMPVYRQYRPVPSPGMRTFINHTEVQAHFVF